MIQRTLHLLERPRPWRRLLDELPAEEFHRARTADGHELALRRLTPASGEVVGPPVMLLHGLAANHTGFHMPERSLASWLVARGHDVWMPELRGHGDSAPRHYGWRLDDYLTQDLPSILETILSRSGQERLHWVGHSMGGVLLMCYGIMNPDAPIARGVTVASALDYRVGATGFKALLALRPVIERLEVIPYGGLVHMLSPALGRGSRAIERFNVWPENVEPRLVRRLHARVFHAIPTSLLSSLATTFEETGFRLETGQTFLDAAQDFSFPLLMLAGSRDMQVSVGAVEHTAALIGEEARAITFGRERGHALDYGHFDLIIGRRAPAEVWPELAAWLEA